MFTGKTTKVATNKTHKLGRHMLSLLYYFTLIEQTWKKSKKNSANSNLLDEIFTKKIQKT